MCCTKLQVLANECSIGFEAIRNSIVRSVNGTRIRNLRQLAEVVDSCTEEFLRFEVGRSMLVVLETKKLKEATQQVQYCPSLYSTVYLNGKYMQVSTTTGK